MQSFQQQPQPQPQPAPALNTGQPTVSFHPELLIDQNTKELQLTGGTFSFAGKEISLPSIPVAFPAIPALNTLSAVFPGAQLPLAPTACAVIEYHIISIEYKARTHVQQ